MRLRIRIVATHPLVADSLTRMLADDCELKKLLFYPPISNNQMVTRDKPYAFVVDAFSTETELPQLIRSLRLRCKGSRFLVLVSPEKGNNEQILRLLYEGIDGVAVVSRGLQDELPAAVRTILTGNIFAPSQVLAEYVHQTSLLLEPRFLHDFSLTARESQVLQLMIRRLSNKEIAAALRIKHRTVRFHVSNIFSKLRVGNRIALLDLIEKLA